MIHDDDFYFSGSACREVFDKHRALAKGKSLVYSNADIMASRVPMACAKRLHDYLPDARVLLIVRNQLTAIPSYYANHGAFLKPAPPSHFHRFVSFDDWMSHCTRFMKYSPLSSYFYSEYLRIYSDLFGKDRITVLLFEDFVNDRERFVRELSEVLRVGSKEVGELLSSAHERKRVSMRTLRFQKFRNMFLWGVPLARLIPGGNTLSRGWRRWLESGPKADGFVSEFWKSKIERLYAESNATLLREFDVPIDRYGYPMPVGGRGNATEKGEARA